MDIQLSGFNIQCGCRQGDLILPYLFILCVEILAIMIREDEDIKGININKIEPKISQFTDDAQLMNNRDRKSFENQYTSLTNLDQSLWSVHECRQNTSHMVTQ